MDKKENIYSSLLKNCDSLGIKVKQRSKESENSYVFDFKDDKLCQNLIETFDITEKDVFKEAFEQACSGSGNEKKNLSVLHSSALCSLLFFHNVTEDHNLKLNLDNDEVVFDKSYFEVKNKVLVSPSNVDVVLVSKKQKKILFLESKFSEYYLDNNKGVKISKKYRSSESCCHSFYTDEELKKLNFFIAENEDKHFTLKSNPSEKTGRESYVEGIKQMISHYIGIHNFSKGELYEKDSKQKPIINDLYNLFKEEEYKLYLGEILFDFENEEIRKYQADYEEKYTKLAEYLNRQPDKIKCLDSVLHYSDLKDSGINERIRKFYFG